MLCPAYLIRVQLPGWTIDQPLALANGCPSLYHRNLRALHGVSWALRLRSGCTCQRACLAPTENWLTLAEESLTGSGFRARMTWGLRKGRSQFERCGCDRSGAGCDSARKMVGRNQQPLVSGIVIDGGLEKIVQRSPASSLVRTVKEDAKR